MTEKRFEIKPSAMHTNKYVIHDSEKEYTFPILDSTLNYMFCKAMNELHEENKELKDKYERKDRQLQQAKKDTRKYTEYFMNELNWDCDRIIKEVFR